MIGRLVFRASSVASVVSASAGIIASRNQATTSSQPLGSWSRVASRHFWMARLQLRHRQALIAQAALHQLLPALERVHVAIDQARASRTGP